MLQIMNIRVEPHYKSSLTISDSRRRKSHAIADGTVSNYRATLYDCRQLSATITPWLAVGDMLSLICKLP